MNNKHFVGVDIGGTKISIALFENYKIIKKLKLITNPIDCPTKNKPGLIAENIIKSIDSFKDNIVEIGIATTGIINNGRWSVLNRKILGEFYNFPLTKYIQDKLNIPVFAFSDTEAAALAELEFGAGQKLSNFFYITVSTGVGGSMVIENKLYSKSPNLAGAFGHMVIVQNGKLCGCGRRGCIESYASGTAIDQILKLSKYKDLTAKEMLLNYHKAAWSKRIIEEVSEYLAEGVVNVNSLLGIENFIIGGSIGLNSMVFGEIKKQTKLISNAKIKFKKAKLKNDAEVFGCLAKSSIHRLSVN